MLVLPVLAGCTAPPGSDGPGPWPGAAQVDGPATSPLPLLPLRVNAQGEVEGVPANLRPYQYCAREEVPALQTAYQGEEVLRYFQTPEWIEAYDAWFEARLGQPVRPEHVLPGEGALAAWRSVGGTGKDVVLFWVVRPNRTLDLDPEVAGVVPGMLADGLVAFSATSPYYCCTLGYKLSPIARMQGRWDFLFDTCHFSTYDPHHVVQGRIPPCSSAKSQPERYRCPEPATVPPASPRG